MEMRTKEFFIASFSTILWVTVFSVGICNALGEVITDEIFSPSLDGNLLGDSATRPMKIYLPPSYNSGNSRYPVIYYLHGYTGDEKGWLSCGIHTAMDELIAQGEVQEMILVMPNAQNQYDGSWYANSSVAGNYEDYIAGDLVDFIDGKYRTLSQRESRAIAGGSMGGHGAMKLAIKRPDVYCAVVSHSGVLSLNQWRSFAPFVNSDRGLQAMAIAFSPNPDAALLYDVPTNEDNWNRWLEHDPTTLVETHLDNLRQLAGIYFDHGTSDGTVEVAHARKFSQTLTQAGISHVYEEYDGDHTDQWPFRIHIALPFLSDLLSSDILLSSNILTSVQPKGKLAMTWASLKVRAD